MRTLVLLPLCLATAAAATVVEPPPAPPPAREAIFAPQTQATIDWIAEMEAQDEAQRVAPPAELAEPAPGTVPGTGIQRCAAPDGTVVFTDRSCAEMGAIASAAPSAGNAGTRLFVRSCARTREALVDGLRDALGARDANRVASYYHWTGMGNRAAYALMDRLSGFAERPLMDVQLVTSASLADRRDQVPPQGWYSMLPPMPEPPAPRPPDLVRVDQMRGEKDVASEVTYFHLQANAGCWWIRF
jgi:hypothetical protein